MDQKIRDFWKKLNSDVSDLWQNNKLFLIFFGVLILVIKFRMILINILIDNAKKLAENSKEKDKEMQAKEQNYKSQADALVEKTKQNSKSNEKITEDWYKK